MNYDRSFSGPRLRVYLLRASTALAALAAMLFRSTPPSLAAEAQRPPNVVVILADDMGYSDLGCYGGEIQTPNLDRLAAHGLRFTQCYNTARCWPSRAAIMTGYYAQQVRRDTVPGVPKTGGQGTRPAWAPLLPELLRSKEYRNYHSGKWHIDQQPLACGFDHSYELDDHDRFFTPKRHDLDGRPLPQPGEADGFYTTDAIAQHAIEMLQEHQRAYAKQPFFLYLCFTSPHFPLQAPEEVIARYRDTYRQGWNRIQESRGRRLLELGLVSNQPPAMELQLGPPYFFPDAYEKLGSAEVSKPFPWNDLTPEQQAFQATKMAVHAAMVDRMDQNIGRVLQQLNEMGAWNDTLILFASDNGASAEIMVRGDGHDPNAPAGSGKTFLCLGPGWSSAANTPFRRHKTWVHEGGISTPLIAHWPRGISDAGELRHTPVHFIDVVPTVLELAGIEPPKEWGGMLRPALPGKSMVPLFAQDGTVGHDYLWWLHEGNRAIRVGDWKLVAARDEPWELYNLQEDRGESHNLVGEFPDRATRLQTLWEEAWEQFQADAKRDLKR
ncbi:arylsulfatase [Thermopirellula anaerolimosa]